MAARAHRDSQPVSLGELQRGCDVEGSRRSRDDGRSAVKKSVEHRAGVVVGLTV
jgi:hypothetical protein